MDVKKIGVISIVLVVLLFFSGSVFAELNNPFSTKDNYHEESSGDYSTAMGMLESLGYDGDASGLKTFQNDHGSEINNYRSGVNYETITPANDGKLGYGTIEALNNKWSLQKEKERKQKREENLAKKTETHKNEKINFGGSDNSWFGKVVGFITYFGSLEFLFGHTMDGKLCGFIRIALAIMIFSILYMALGALNNATGGESIPKNIAITISTVMSIITAIFIPCSVMFGFGGTYATLFSLIIIGGPMVGIGWLIFGTPTESRGVAAMKLFGILLLWWLISQINTWAIKLSDGALVSLI